MISPRYKKTYDALEKHSINRCSNFHHQEPGINLLGSDREQAQRGSSAEIVPAIRQAVPVASLLADRRCGQVIPALIVGHADQQKLGGINGLSDGSQCCNSNTTHDEPAYQSAKPFR